MEIAFAMFGSEDVRMFASRPLTPNPGGKGRSGVGPSIDSRSGLSP